MKKNLKAGLLSLIAVVQVSIIVAGFFAYQQMYEMLWKSMLAYKELREETGGPIIDYGLIPNPFAPLAPLIFLSLFLTIVLLVDEVRHKSADN
jgi:hypothetical protein